MFSECDWLYENSNQYNSKVIYYFIISSQRKLSGFIFCKALLQKSRDMIGHHQWLTVGASTRNNAMVNVV